MTQDLSATLSRGNPSDIRLAHAVRDGRSLVVATFVRDYIGRRRLKVLDHALRRYGLDRDRFTALLHHSYGLDRDRFTALLHVAIANDQLCAVQLLLRAIACISQSDVGRECFDVVRSMKATVKEYVKLLSTEVDAISLCMAFDAQSWEVARYLLEKKPSADCVQLCLVHAVRARSLALMRFALDHGAEAALADSKGRVPFNHCLDYIEHNYEAETHEFESLWDIARELNSRGASLPEVNGQSMAHAVYSDYLKMDEWSKGLDKDLFNYRRLEFVAKVGTEINARDEDGKTVLYRAVEAFKWHDEPLSGVVQFLHWGADPNIPNHNDEYPLIKAFEHIWSSERSIIGDGWREHCRSLIRVLSLHNADPVCAGVTIGAAATAGLWQLMEQLIASGADVCAGAMYGDILSRAARLRYFSAILTADGLQAAAQAGRAAVKTGPTRSQPDLIDYNFDLASEIHDGRDALHIAIMLGHLEVVRLLLAAGADLEARDWHSRTPLIAAAEQGDCRLVEALLKLGANTKARDRESRTAVIASIEGSTKSWKYSRWWSSEDTIHCLVEGGADINAYSASCGTAVAITAHTPVGTELSAYDRDRVVHKLVTDFGAKVENACYGLHDGACNAIQGCLDRHEEWLRKQELRESQGDKWWILKRKNR